MNLASLYKRDKSCGKTMLNEKKQMQKGKGMYEVLSTSGVAPASSAYLRKKQTWNLPPSVLSLRMRPR